MALRLRVGRASEDRVEQLAIDLIDTSQFYAESADADTRTLAAMYRKTGQMLALALKAGRIRIYDNGTNLRKKA